MADVDPRTLSPGTILRHRNGKDVVPDRRKEDNSGWWNTDTSGLIDSVILTDDWTVVEGGAPVETAVDPTRWLRQHRLTFPAHQWQRIQTVLAALPQSDRAHG